jgi:hypothetical protein
MPHEPRCLATRVRDARWPAGRWPSSAPPARWANHAREQPPRRFPESLLLGRRPLSDGLGAIAPRRPRRSRRRTGPARRDPQGPPMEVASQQDLRNLGDLQAVRVLADLLLRFTRGVPLVDRRGIRRVRAALRAGQGAARGRLPDPSRRPSLDDGRVHVGRDDAQPEPDPIRGGAPGPPPPRAVRAAMRCFRRAIPRPSLPARTH